MKKNYREAIELVDIEIADSMYEITQDLDKKTSYGNEYQPLTI